MITTVNCRIAKLLISNATHNETQVGRQNAQLRFRFEGILNCCLAIPGANKLSFSRAL